MHRLASRALGAAAAVALVVAEAAAAPSGPPPVRIPGGSFTPALQRTGGTDGGPPLPRVTTAVAPFELDAHPVTQGEFLAFVRAVPQWRRSRVPRVFAEKGYLADWKDDLALPEAAARAPVTQVSWFAARAYCRWRGRRLPTVDEWEYVLADGGRNTAAREQASLRWHEQPATRALPAVDGLPRNGYGVAGMYGVVWEWTLDFNAAMDSGEQRSDDGGDANLFCGGAAAGVDPSDYLAFLRYGYRNSLKANYTVRSLGFRCARGGEVS